MSTGVKALNPNADVVRRGMALSTTVNAAVGLQGTVKSNLGPKGTLKM
jgi:T-complex protein 1 subunit zeta